MSVGPTADSLDHLKILLTGAGILLSFLVGLLGWVIKRDIGKMDGQLKDITVALTKADDEFVRHEKQAIDKFGKIETALMKLVGRLDSFEKLCAERNKNGVHHYHERKDDV